jgi:hypothetical protein
MTEDWEDAYSKGAIEQGERVQNSHQVKGE